jgi:hypothetical protein
MDPLVMDVSSNDEKKRKEIFSFNRTDMKASRPLE